MWFHVTTEVYIELYKSIAWNINRTFPVEKETKGTGRLWKRYREMIEKLVFPIIKQFSKISRAVNLF